MRISENLSPGARKVLAMARNALFEGSVLDSVQKAIQSAEPKGLPHVFGAMVVKLIDRANQEDIDPAELWADEGVAEHLVEDMFKLAVSRGAEITEDELPSLYDETMDSVEDWASAEPPDEQTEAPMQPPQPGGFIGGV